MKITFDDLEKMGYESVTDYCRYLVEQWDPYCTYSLKDKIEVFRGEMLCLTVRSIEEGSKLTIQETGTKGPRFVKYEESHQMSEKDKERLRLNRQKKGVWSDQGFVKKEKIGEGTGDV